ncbi:lytic polysaccharide monooxygenase [Rouxiella badensis]|uniref:lytic polysaccharide monooxygenase n=1 Tax=Rouxiella badensis TaxID=1646377 RepID=UPI00301C2D99
MKTFKLKSLALLTTLSVGGFLHANMASAHGYLENPPARGFFCRAGQAGAGSPGCKAVGQFSGAVTTPQEIVGGGLNYKETLKKGKICAADSRYPNLGLPANQWKHKAITVKNGKITLDYRFTAHHGTDHIGYYITKPGTNNADTIGWEDLQELARFDGVKGPNGQIGGFGIYSETVDLPSNITDGDYTIVTMWPVSRQHGTGENFTSCSDVTLTGLGQGGGEVVDSWGVIGDGVTATKNLKAGDTVTFRLFKAGADAGKVSYTLTENLSSYYWLPDLGDAVNDTKNFPVKIGDTLKGDEVSIEYSDDHYNVYAKGKNTNYSYVITLEEQTQPGTGASPVPVITASSNTITDSEWLELDALKTTDPDTSNNQLKYTWEVTRNADKVELANTSGAETRIRLHKPADSDFNVSVKLTVTDPQKNKGEVTKILKAEHSSEKPGDEQPGDEQPGGEQPGNPGDAAAYNARIAYPTKCTKVSHNGQVWQNQWYVNAGQEEPGKGGSWGAWRTEKATSNQCK